MLLRFLFEFGFPWLGFRRATRMGDSAKMNSMYAFALPWFRATKKHQYARICVDFVWVLLTANPVIINIFNERRTCSLLGNTGYNIAWDQACEFLNLDLKNMNPKDPTHIDRILLMLNGVKHTDTRIRSALGIERDDPNEYTQVKAHHTEAIVSSLKKTLGSNMEKLFTDQEQQSHFGDGPRPWVKVRNPGNLVGATSEELQLEERKWVISQLDSNPFPS